MCLTLLRPVGALRCLIRPRSSGRLLGALEGHVRPVPATPATTERLGPARADLELCFQDVQRHLLVPLLLLAAQEVLPFRVVLAYPLQAALNKPFNVGAVEGQAKVEHLAIVAMVVA